MTPSVISKNICYQHWHTDNAANSRGSSSIGIRFNIDGCESLGCAYLEPAAVTYFIRSAVGRDGRLGIHRGEASHLDRFPSMSDA